MQVKNIDGSYGEPIRLSDEDLKKALANPNTSHVEIFEPTPENLEYRRKFLGVRKRNYKKPKK